MPSPSDIKAGLAAAASKAATDTHRAQAGAAPPGGPQGIFDVSNDGTTWHPAVRLRASTGTAFTVVDGEVQLATESAGLVEHATTATFRASPPPADGTVFRIVSPPGEYRYSTTSGAGWADDDRTILKPTSVLLGSNGRAFSTAAGATCPTFDALRGLKSGKQDHVHLQSHTTFGDGGGGIFDRVAVGAYVDDGGRVAVAGVWAYVRRVDKSKPAHVSEYGAPSDGTTDASATVAACFANNSWVSFSGGGSYLLRSEITKTANGIRVAFGDATLINGGPNYLFTFGTSGDTASCSNLKISGGTWIQENPSTTADRNYIRVASVDGYEVKNCVLNNVSNGGLVVHAGSNNGKISKVEVKGKTGASTVRGIWLAGSTASDFAAQLVDETSITRNATALPSYYVGKCTISDCKVTVSEYGIYLMNARDVTIENCDVDISGVGATRCIAVNNYSPRTKIKGGTLTSDRSSTGVLVTQFSDGVKVSDVTFCGSFGGNRSVYVAYGAKATVSGCHFFDDTTQNIQVDMGGFAVVKDNEFLRSVRTADNRAVYVTAIDPTQTGGSVGSTATVLQGGVIFKGNTLDKLCVAVHCDTALAASNANAPGLATVHCVDNVQMGMNLAATASEYGMTYACGAVHATNLRYERNTILPYTASTRNIAQGTGAAAILECTNAFVASFLVTVASGGGAITSTKFAGGNMSMSVSRSGADLILVPRTQLGTGGANVPFVLGITDGGGVTSPHVYRCVPSGSNFVVTAFDAAGGVISFATAGISFRCLLGPVQYGS